MAAIFEVIELSISYIPTEIPTNSCSNQVFNAYFSSKIRYGIETYGITTERNLKQLQVQQNRALKILFNKEYRTSTKQLHKELNLLLVKDLRNLCLVQQPHKQLFNQHEKDQHNTQITFQRNTNIHAYNTRQLNQLHTPKYNTTIGQSTIEHTASQLWNKLPENIQNTEKLHQFKKKTKAYYISNY